MNQNKHNKYVKHFPANTTGKDYIVGDIHGCYRDLMGALIAIGFGAGDRLFCVGDLIDRGPDSIKCVDLLKEDWVHSIRGNHEQMMIDSIIGNNYQTSRVWLANGGQWSLRVDQRHLVEIAKALDELPYVITVGTGRDRFNIVHGDLLKTNEDVSDQDIDNWTFDDNSMTNMLWGRNLACDWINIRDYKDWSHYQQDLSMTYCGHTPSRSVFKACKQIFLDRGCVYHHTSRNKSEQNALAIACHQDRVVHQWVPLWKTISTITYDEIKPVTRSRY